MPRTYSFEQLHTVSVLDIVSLMTSAELRLKELGIMLSTPPEPFGMYAEAVQTGNLLFLTGMLPTEGRAAKVVGRVGAELDAEGARQAARLAALNVVSVATSGDVRDQARVADGASELLRDVFGDDKAPCRSVYGVASLPLGVPVEVEIILEVAP